MLESPSRIVLGIVGACVLLTVLVLFRSSEEEKEPAVPPRPGSVTSQSLKPRPAGQVGHHDNDSGSSSGGIDRPRGLPGSAMEAPRPGSVSTSEGKIDSGASDVKHREVAPAAGRNLAAEPLPVAPPGSGVLAPGGGNTGVDADALAAMPAAPKDASLAVPFRGNGSSLGSMAPMVEENVVYDLDEGAYFPPDARFAFGNSGTVQNNAGTIAFWMKPNWDGTDPRNASLVQYHTEDWSNRLNIFKNGIYLRYLFTDNSGSETNLSVNMAAEGWAAGDWHQIAVTWGDSLIGMYVDGTQRQQGTYMGELDVPSGTALYVGSDSPGGNPGADATLQDFVVVDRAMDAGELRDMYNQGRSAGKS